ncbi:copper chaperone PCu(A)C [Pseudoalteromonas piratica]|uniref:copper chaperone PCu(A)C n=1 Tax=Pseudoalteromonas piratica TaxID=1348114 RepID=UPI0006893BBF|nr:copper chaperone PCu(A)C [Pseudoalteromonas piratica]
MLKRYLFFVISFFSFSLAANQVLVSDFTVREFIPGAPSSVGYLKITNHSDKELVLSSVSLDKLGRVEIHNHIQKNGMMSMVKLDKLAIDMHSTKVFQSGGLHLMLFSPKAKLIKGETINAKFHFASGLTVDAKATVVGINESIENEHQHHHHH